MRDINDDNLKSEGFRDGGFYDWDVRDDTTTYDSDGDNQDAAHSDLRCSDFNELSPLWSAAHSGPTARKLFQQERTPSDFNFTAKLSAYRGRIITLALIVSFLLHIIVSPKMAWIHAQYGASAFIIAIAAIRLLALGLACFSGTPPLQFRPTSENTTLPRFTVLVPVYKEANMIPSLLHHLSKLDYPAQKLQIIIVCEQDDLATCNAVRQHLRAPFSLFETPPSFPRTKPKALNAALSDLAPDRRGDIITVYDAEDRPHPHQLKAAAKAFAQDSSVAVVQAPLGFYNADRNILTRLFALEYAALFHVWNPMLTKLGLPFTLGGTSNHIRRDVLEHAGGWDAHNVTEDADLGFRLSALRSTGQSYNISCIGFGTQEEAVSNLPMWTAQRSRWIKGFIQTWAVHMRAKPSGPAGDIFTPTARLKNAAALHITLSATLLATFLHVPSLFLIFGALIGKSMGWMEPKFDFFFYFVLCFGYGAAITNNIAGAILAKKPRLIAFSVLMPFYWLLHFPAALIALYEFFTAPSLWRKTEHHGEGPVRPNPHNTTGQFQALKKM